MKRYGFKFVDIATQNRWTPEIRFFIIIASFIAPAFAWVAEHNIYFGPYIAICFLCIIFTMLVDIISIYILGVLVLLGLSAPVCIFTIFGAAEFTQPEQQIFTAYAVFIALISAYPLYVTIKENKRKGSSLTPNAHAQGTQNDPRSKARGR